MEQLKVEGISKSFDGEQVLEDISITLNKGELVSLLGISGGGKTTLFNIIAGLSRPDTGHGMLLTSGKHQVAHSSLTGSHHTLSVQCNVHFFAVW